MVLVLVNSNITGAFIGKHPEMAAWVKLHHLEYYPKALSKVVSWYSSCF